MRATLLCACLGLSAVAVARPWWIQGTAAPEHDFLAPDIAFRVDSRLDGDELHVRWLIADGYYLYRQKMQILPESADLLTGPLQLPAGAVQTDPYFGAQEVYRREVEAVMHLLRQDYGAHPVQVKVSYQGCADAGLCYPAINKVLFPRDHSDAPGVRQHPPLHWQLLAILGGCAAFLVAGMRLRRGREYAAP